MITGDGGIFVLKYFRISIEVFCVSFIFNIYCRSDTKMQLKSKQNKGQCFDIIDFLNLSKVILCKHKHSRKKTYRHKTHIFRNKTFITLTFCAKDCTDIWR